MEQLPGEPTQINSSGGIRKTTKLFPETMKLRKGGFAALHRVTLRSVASWTGRAVEVAIKQLTGKIEGWSYNCIRASKSNINHVHQKGIVALGRCNTKARGRAGHSKLQSASQGLHKLRLPCCVPAGLCTSILLLICSHLCCYLAKSDTTVHRTVNRPCHLGSYLENSSFALNLTDKAAFCVPNLTPPGASLFDSSFTITFTVSIYQQVSNLLRGNNTVVFLAIQPSAYPYGYYDDPTFSRYNGQYVDSSSSVRPRTSYPTAASKVSAWISRPVNDTRMFIWVQIDTDPPHNSSCVENTYSVTIRYYDVYSLMSVHVKGDGMWQPVNVTTKILSGKDMPMSVSMGYLSSIGHLLNLGNWNMEMEEDDVGSGYGDFSDSGSQHLSLVAILLSVLGSVAAIAITAIVVYLYFNSKYRRWKTEQDKLAKIMQDLPGVPTKVDFTDIKKATKNFHETMKLGKGGFGAVYRCMLPTSASRMGQAMEVAVKKFMQDVENRCYNDFLAEVSIINRLRHKNIVPLIGWSYNKGVPLLVYEYMENGSLDQHIFRGGASNHHHINAAVCQWDTRYSIVRDIATGLHYVHHEHEPMVLHRDIKASNIMLDSTFRARLGDFGIACTVAANKSYVTGIAGTFGYIAPDYAMSHKATRQTDIYAFGVLILEVVTGKKNGDVLPDDDHITEWVWRLHREGMLLEAVDSMLITTGGKNTQDDLIFTDEAKRLLLLGLACTNPNPSNRPSMAEVVQVITKVAPTPEVPRERPTFVWPPEDWRMRNSVHSTAMSHWERRSGSSGTIELAHISRYDQSLSASAREQTSYHSGAGSASCSVTAAQSPPSQ